MKTFTYDLCLLIIITDDSFDLIEMQTNDIIILTNDRFNALKENELKKINFLAKSKEKLISNNLLIFNECVLIMTNDVIHLRQKDQTKKIQLVDLKTSNFSNFSMKKTYVKQRAREAYIASMCQPEASFDLSVAAQHQNPAKDDVLALNKRLQ